MNANSERGMLRDLALEMDQISARIRRDPANAALRICLFQLLCVQGQWSRALTQLQAAAQLDPSAIPMAQTYREAIRCEVLRAEVFAGQRTPQTIGEPTRWLSLLIEALRLDAAAEHAGAAALRAEAFEAADVTAARIDDVPSGWIADADSRLGPVCEIILNGQYYWLPFSLISELSFDAPADLRDLVWTPTRLTLVNGGSQAALIPSRYPGSEQDEGFRLCRQTDWVSIGPDAWKGLGQREWISEAGSHPLLDVRLVRLGT